MLRCHDSSPNPCSEKSGEPDGDTEVLTNPKDLLHLRHQSAQRQASPDGDGGRSAPLTVRWMRGLGINSRNYLKVRVADCDCTAGWRQHDCFVLIAGKAVPMRNA